jgi:CheY-like chemotaxis protein
LARKILLADDSVTAQNMGRKILADAGYEVITVNNGSAALKKIAEHKPDLIVLDVYMPGYSGLEVCQRLKEAGDTSRIPVLLTVGKLEPFKPEEARRVRADGYIVKPFEASELLSALSKLEDKVVPRSEPSKPGRFARATAAIEESRFDKSMAVDEDSGWKSRIVFPKKKEKPPEPEVEEPVIYNPVNKDLRTVIEHKVEEHSPAAHGDRHSEEERVNLGALAPEGLPKDVTPEEIAALAAAAAQVKGTLEEHKTVEEKTAAPISEITAPAVVEAPAVTVETKTEESLVAEPIAQPVPAADAVPAPEATAAPAEQPKSEKTEKEAGPEAAASPSDVMAAIVGLEQQSAAGGSGNGSWSHRDKADEPVTMAVAASAAAGAQSSRWTAVATALAPEEASLSLEQEMQKAYAAFAAAETAHTEAAQTVSEPVAASISEPTPAPTAVETPTAHSDETAASVSIPAVPAPEAALSFAEVASTAKDAVSAAISELESVAASYAPKESVAAAEAASVFTSEPAAPTISEPAPVVEPKSEEPIIAESSKSVEAPVESKPEATEVKPETAPEIATSPSEIEAKSEEAEAKPGEPVAAVEEQPALSVEEKEQKTEIAEPAADSAPAAREVEVSEAQASPKEVVPEVAASKAASSTAVSPIAGGIEDMAKKESENTAAAAWASWRKIRETGNSKSVEAAEPANETAESLVDRDSAAMAVAVGAESSPEDVNASLDSDPEIASIVDSVLADMRPKIVEEIARKLGKKK